MAMSASRSLGAVGEGIAARYLADRGWEILQRNWRCQEGEIDLIAADPEGTVVFVEVKSRAGLGFGYPLEAITHAKLAKLRQLAAVWLAAHGPVDTVRLDAIGVLLPRGGQPTVSHVSGIA